MTHSTFKTTTKLRTIALASTFALTLGTTAALAGSQLTPGISTGLAMGQPLPEGLYSITIPTWGSRNTAPASTDIGAIAPAWLIWSSPWTLAGGRIGFDVVTPLASVSIDNPVGLHKSGLLNPLLEATIKWDLGNGFNFGLQEGVFLPVKNSLTDIGAARDFTSFMQVAALSYVKDGWNLSTTVAYGTGKKGIVPGKFGTSWFNYDLTATKTIGKWEFGAIAFGSTDLSSPYVGYKKQKQFAVGGLVGYNFGPVITQLKLSTDVAQTNYGGKETRVWANIIIPLWNPAGSAKPVVAKY